MTVAQDSAKELLTLAQKRHLTYKRSISVKLDERIVLHLEDRGAGFGRTVDLLLRKLLTDAGVDLTKPHPRETYAKDGSTLVTYQDFWDQGGELPGGGSAEPRIGPSGATA